MRGKVATPILNVRLTPAGKIVGQVHLNEIVKITDRDDEWLEIDYKGLSRYVMKEFVFEKGDPLKRGKVKISSLLVRNRPSVTSGDIVGKYRFGDNVEILEEESGWVKILYNGNIAFAAKKFIDFDSAFRDEVLFSAPTRTPGGDRIIKRGKITASSLRVRKRPDGKVIGKVPGGAMVSIIDEKNDWYKIGFGEKDGFVAKKFIDIRQGAISDDIRFFDRGHINGKRIGKLKKDDVVYIIDENEGWIKFHYKRNKYGYLPITELKTEQGEVMGEFLYAKKDMHKIPLEPKRKMELRGDKATLATINIWNKYGNLISILSKQLGIDVATAIAVFQTESGGSGYRKGKLIIRFENHLFYSYWGKYNEETYNKFFRYNPRVRFRDHYFRTKEKGDWIKMHNYNSQDIEWKALEFASKLDRGAALKSISMGAPQILGSNHRIIGYPDVNLMFNYFEKDIRYHIIGFFDFCKANAARLRAMKKRDFVTFARYYNGSGQEKRYGAVIKRYYNAFKDA